MQPARLVAAIGVLALAGANVGLAQTATQTVTFQVDAINQVGVAGTPSLTITTAIAGSAPTSVSSTGNTWAVTTNQTGAKITGSIASNMAAGLTLSATLGAPAGGTSTGSRPLSTVATDLVTGITKLNAPSLALQYDLDATSAAGVIVSGTRIVTFTITGGA